MQDQIAQWAGTSNREQEKDREESGSEAARIKDCFPDRIKDRGEEGGNDSLIKVTDKKSS